MSGGASKLRDVRKLADSRAVFELDVPLLQLPNVPPEFSSGDGTVRAHLSFGREQGFALAQVALDAQLAVNCQRCLSPMQLAVHTSSPVLIVESEREAEEAPAGWETFLAPEGRVDFEALVAEELLLALPIVPLHERASECAALMGADPAAVAARGGAHAASEASSGAAAATQAAATEPATTRPFADLRNLLERAAASSGSGSRRTAHGSESRGTRK
jgi:uncharacterized protein